MFFFAAAFDADPIISGGMGGAGVRCPLSAPSSVSSSVMGWSLTPDGALIPSAVMDSIPKHLGKTVFSRLNFYGIG